MSSNNRDQEQIASDLFRRLDSGGELGEMIRAFSPLVSSRLGRGLLRIFKLDPQEFERLLQAPRQLIDGFADTVQIFTPLGWAPSSRAPVQPCRDALALYRRTGDLDAAQSLLVSAWNEPNRLRFLLRPLVGLGAGFEAFNETFRLRWRLVDKALNHHYAGAYEATVPITLAQIDGIVSDVTESQIGFFHGRNHEAHLVDDQTVAGIPEGLEPLRVMTSQPQRKSSATGALARHGILHGRELGYDTLLNSTKALVLLIAVIDWAQPRAMAIAERLRNEAEARYAGSAAVDDRGRRLDRRGFDRAQQGLRNLAGRQMAEFRNHNKYGNDLEVMFPGTSREDDYLRGKLEITLVTSDNRDEYWAWRSTLSGFFFGIAGRGGAWEEWLFAAPRPPNGGPSADTEWRRLLDPPPDWS